MKVDQKDLTEAVEALLGQYGCYVADPVIEDLVVEVNNVIENMPTYTVYVFSWDPQHGVGGFDWYWHMEQAAKRLDEESGNPDYVGVRIDTVEVPAELGVEDEPSPEITDWLDAHWYDR